MRRLLLVLALAAGVVSCQHKSDVNKPESLAGQWAMYNVESLGGALPAIDQLRISIPAGEELDGKQAVWFQVEALQDGQRLFAFAMLTDMLDFLVVPNSQATVYRYVLFSSVGQPLEYVNKRTKLAELPRMEFLKNLVPRSTNPMDENLPFFKQGSYLGRKIELSETGTAAQLLPIDKVKKLVMDMDVIVGNSHNKKETDTARIYVPPVEQLPGNPEYTYVSYNEADYKEMLEAGFNFFRVGRNEIDYVLEEPALFTYGDTMPKYPALLYRSNYFGPNMFMDEPAIRTAVVGQFFDELDHYQRIADYLGIFVRGRYELNYAYGSRSIINYFKRDGYDFGGLDLREVDYPLWETIISSACYQLASGMTGIVYEGRYRVKTTEEMIERELGVDFPSTAEATMLLHQAMVRGAARYYNAKWGVAIYGQMEFGPAALNFPMTYDAGATYFWFWTLDHSHHLPQREQLQYARALQEHIKNNPRKATPGELTRSAKTVVIFPWGYLLDDSVLDPWEYKGKTPKACMWWSSEMEMDDKNRKGVAHRQVLKAGMEIIVDLLEKGEDFDILFLRERDMPDDAYTKIYRVSEEAIVTEQ